PAEVSQNGGFFYCPDEVIDHRDRGQRMLECGQIMRKVTDQRRSAIRTGPSGSDKALYVNQTGDIFIVPSGCTTGMRICCPSPQVCALSVEHQKASGRTSHLTRTICGDRAEGRQSRERSHGKHMYNRVITRTPVFSIGADVHDAMAKANAHFFLWQSVARDAR